MSEGFYSDYGRAKPRGAKALYPAPIAPSLYNREELESSNKIRYPDYNYTRKDSSLLKINQVSSDIYGVTAKVFYSNNPPLSQFNRYELKPANPIRSPEYTPYDPNKVPTEVLMDSEQAEIGQFTTLQASRMILDSIPLREEIRRTYWSRIIERLVKLDMISALRPLTEEQKKIKDDITVIVDEEKKRNADRIVVMPLPLTIPPITINTPAGGLPVNISDGSRPRPTPPVSTSTSSTTSTAPTTSTSTSTTGSAGSGTKIEVKPTRRSAAIASRVGRVITYAEWLVVQNGTKQSDFFYFKNELLAIITTALWLTTGTKRQEILLALDNKLMDGSPASVDMKLAIETGEINRTLNIFDLEQIRDDFRATYIPSF